MSNNELAALLFVGGVVIGTSIVAAYIKEESKSKKHREEIKRNESLDRLAIHRAKERMMKKIADGEYLSNPMQTTADFEYELAFEKIAVRYKR